MAAPPPAQKSLSHILKQELPRVLAILRKGEFTIDEVRQRLSNKLSFASTRSILHSLHAEGVVSSRAYEGRVVFFLLDKTSVKEATAELGRRWKLPGLCLEQKNSVLLLRCEGSAGKRTVVLPLGWSPESITLSMIEPFVARLSQLMEQIPTPEPSPAEARRAPRRRRARKRIHL